MAQNSESDALPWGMTKPEVAKFRELLGSVRCYVEFGSGGTTSLAVGSGVRTIVSIECDPKWADEIRSRPDVRAAIERGQCELRYIDLGPVGAWGAPLDQSMLAQWPDYYWGVWSTIAGADFVFVDGRFRVQCVLVAALVCDPGTVIAIHDYPERQQYHIIEDLLELESCVGNLAVFRNQESIDTKAIMICLYDNIFNIN